MKKTLKKLIALLAGWFVAHLVFTLYDGLTDRQTSADVAVVFGSKVHSDGRLSRSLHSRLAQAVQLYQAGRVKRIIVSGGLGREGFYEAEVMRDYLVQQGIPAEQIAVDNAGNDTESTVRNSLAIMAKNGDKTAISVSQYFHQTRIKMLYRKAGFREIESSSMWAFEAYDLYSLPREFVAFYVEWLK